MPIKPASAVFGYVACGEKRVKLRRHKYVEWPPAVSAHSLANSHVRGVQVRALFAVNFNADKRLVEQVCDFSVAEALRLHHVAPVARGVAYADKNGFVFSHSFI